MFDDFLWFLWKIPFRRPESQTNDLGMFFAMILIICRTPFGVKFFYISWLPKNSCLATGIIRNACFFFIWASKIHPKIMFFQNTFLNILFDNILILLENNRFGDPSKSSGRQDPPTPAGVRRCQIEWPHRGGYQCREPQIFFFPKFQKSNLVTK